MVFLSAHQLSYLTSDHQCILWSTPPIVLDINCYSLANMSLSLIPMFSSPTIISIYYTLLLKVGFQGASDFGFWILWNLASTYVLRQPCSSSLDFGISQGSGWWDLVMSKECNLSQFQNWGLVYMSGGLIYWVGDWGLGRITKNNMRLEDN